VLAEILPAGAVAAEAFGDLPDAVLFPAEEIFVARAVDSRRREYATARACARAALARLGIPPTAILLGEHGAPQWPPDIVGSMTHCAGYRAAAVARKADVLALGLDAEPDEKLPEEVLGAIALDDERTQLTALAAEAPGPSWDRLLFSAKESVYKAWFPLTGRWLGFEEAVISINPVSGTLTARLLVPGPTVHGSPLTRFTGRWLARDGLLLTAIAVPGRDAVLTRGDAVAARSAEVAG
jgi:4'-phosphopantetheinyl transferase EntD